MWKCQPATASDDATNGADTPFDSVAAATLLRVSAAGAGTSTAPRLLLRPRPRPARNAGRGNIASASLRMRLAAARRRNDVVHAQIFHHLAVVVVGMADDADGE